MSHSSQPKWEMYGNYFYNSWLEGETCQSFPNSIRGVGEKSPLPAEEWETLVKGGTFWSGGENLSRSDFWPFSKLKTPFCKYWTSVKPKLAWPV